jgi:predicted dienelactone hydrolase
MKSIVALCLFAASAIAAVKSEEITLRDEKRGKDIECRVHFPDTGDKLPLIIFSHGFGADKTAFATISKHVAEHGYVIVHPSHADGVGRGGLRRGAAELPSQQPKPVEPVDNKTGARRLPGLLGAGGGLAGMLNDPAKIEGRVADVVAVMDSIEQLCTKLPALKGRIDTTRIGVGGHSYGAYTSMLIGGVTADIGGVKARSFADKRVRCILPISGQGTGQQGLTESSWANLKLPMMTMTGSRDQGAGGQGPDWKKEPFKFSPPGDKYLVFIEGANHLSFGGGLGGRSSGEVVKATTRAFWDAYLKNDEQAKAAMKSGEVVKSFSGTARVESK